MKLDFTDPFTERTPRIVNAAKLQRAAGRKKANQFIVEGENAVEAAVATGAARDVFVTEQAARLVAVPVDVSEPGNAGTLVRVSDAMGADAVVFAGETTDPQSSKAARASAGSLFHLPVARNTNIKDVLGQLRAAGLQILATAADGEVELDDAEELLTKPTAWLFGNEAHGLGEELLGLADHRVRIPIRGRAESLNLATAASICLYESAKAQARARG